MAGHSKWANIKYRKNIQDTKRSKISTKIIRELVTAVRLGGKDPSTNYRLRSAINKALHNNITRSNINRAISRAVGIDENVDMETIIYEGYGPGGIAIMLECLSDNRNRTVAELRYMFNKCGGNLSTAGSVSFLFKKTGIIFFNKGDAYDIMNIALKFGADDVVTYNSNLIEVYASHKKIVEISNALEASDYKAESIEIKLVPSTKIDIDNENKIKLFDLINMFKDCNDVQEVYHNCKTLD